MVNERAPLASNTLPAALEALYKLVVVKVKTSPAATEALTLASKLTPLNELTAARVAVMWLIDWSLIE